jgi:hypothetical protein
LRGGDGVVLNDRRRVTGVDTPALIERDDVIEDSWCAVLKVYAASTETVGGEPYPKDPPCWIVKPEMVAVEVSPVTKLTAAPAELPPSMMVFAAPSELVMVMALPLKLMFSL